MISALPIRDSPEQRPRGIWDYISPSRLNLWLKCPLAFRLRYVDGLQTPSSPARFIGKMVHAGLEHWYRHRQLGIDVSAQQIVQHTHSLWGDAAADEAIQFESAAEEAECQRKTGELLLAYLQHVGTEPRPLAVEITVEAPLIDPATGENLGLPLLGIMDLVLPEPDGPLITDFKTASRSADALEVLHEIQLTSYSYLFRQASRQPEGGLEIRSLIKTKQPKIEQHRYPAREERHFRRLFAVIRAYLDDLDSGKFVYRPGFGCSMCDYRCNGCQSWAA